MSTKLESKRKQKQFSRGFTLIEILIALAIFAVLAVITAVGLRSVIDTNQKVDKVDSRVQNILMATTVMRRDISQMIDRPVASENGSKVESLYVPDKSTLEFTRAGFANPEGRLKRSSLQRVRYSFQGHTLIRMAKQQLDGSQGKAQTQVLLKGIKSLYISYVNAKGIVVDAWSTNTSQQDKLPKAVIFSMRLKDFGSLKLIIPIRGRGYGVQ